MPDAWPAPMATGPVHATCVVPGSKSLTNRALVLAALADGPSRIRAGLRARDTLLMAAALRDLGVSVSDADGGDWVVTPAPLRGGASIDCGLAGTVMRFLPLVAALADGPVHFDGDARAWLGERGYDRLYGARPMARLIQEKVKQPLAEELLFGKLAHGGEVHVSVKDKALAFELTPAPPKLVKKKASRSRAQSEPGSDAE